MILAYLTDNPNTPDNDKDTPINEAAHKGHTEIIKILAPLTDNPNDSMYEWPYRNCQNLGRCNSPT